ncbi:hypothetical protein Pan54_22490 [Rubinisphaera italica]|uniref:Uncharacterized protein n=2 Tax=Rubinisphaera italica TaxID=2527969 RepID=A0A5C5XGV3_9PLAN|nr:hypothetical protein Pan54_22490 [Rubinisphaera italica]
MVLLMSQSKLSFYPRIRRLFRWRTEWIVILAGLIVRVCYLSMLTRTPLWEYYHADHAFYKVWGLSIAQEQLSQGHLFEQGPLYAYWLGGLYYAVGDSDAMIVSLQMLAGIHLGCVIFWIGRRLWNEQAAVLAGLLAVTYGPLLYFEGLVMKSWLSPWLTACVCLLMLKVLDETNNNSSRYGNWERVFYCSLAGGLTGLLCLVRENHLLMLVPVALTIWLGMKPLSRFQRAGLMSIALVTCLCVTLPATLHNTIVGRQLVWITSGGGEVLFMGWGPEATGYYQNPSFVRPDPFLEHEDFRLEASRRLGKPVSYAESSSFWSRTAIQDMVTNLPRSLQLLIRKSVILLNDYEIPDSDFYAVAKQIHPLLQYLPTWSWLIGLAVIGLFLGIGNDRRFLIVAGFLLVHVLTILLTYNFSRFRLGMTPFLCLFAAIAIVWILRGSEKGPRIVASFPARLMMLVAAFVISLWTWMPPPDYQQLEFAVMEENFLKRLQDRESYYREAGELTEQRSSQKINADSAYELGIAWMNALQPFRAEKWFRHGLEQNASHSQCWFYLGVLQAKRGQFGKAVSTFQQCAKIDSANADVWANLGSAYFHQALQGNLTLQQRQNYLLRAKDAYRSGLDVEAKNITCLQGIRMIQWALQEDD